MSYETNAQALAVAACDDARKQGEQIADLVRRVEALELAAQPPLLPANFCNYNNLPVSECNEYRCRRLGSCPYAGRQP